MAKRNAAKAEQSGPVTRDMRGVINLLQGVGSMAGVIVGLVETLQKLDTAKLDNKDGTLDWYTGFHSGSIQLAIEQLATAISSDAIAIQDRLTPDEPEVANG